MGSCVGHAPHDLADFVVSDFVVLEPAVVDEHTAAHNIACETHQDDSPADAENQIERKLACSNSAEFILSTQVIERGSYKGSALHSQTERQIFTALQLALSQEIAVRVTLNWVD